MNVLILNWRDIKHPLAGGAEESLFRHATYWKKKGAHIQWFSASISGVKRHETVDGIEHIRAGSHYTVHMYCLLYYLKNKFKKPDLIIDCHHFLPFFTPLFFKNVKKMVFIHEIAGKVWFKNISFPVALTGYLLEPLSLMFYRRVKFITVSQSTKKDLVRHKIPVENIEIVHNGMSKVFISPQIKKEKIPTVIFLGRISEDKGIEDAFQAVSLLQSRIKKLNFWIVGKEQDSGIIESCLKKFTFNQNYDIKYFGFVNQKEKFTLLRKAWVLVHPSLKEGWGLSVIEAGSQKTPTVGYNVEGLRDSIVNGKTGILVKKTPKELARKVELLIVNKKKYQEMSKNSYEWSQKFNWFESTQKSWNIINKIVNEK